MQVNFYIDREKAKERLGINPGGRVQNILDASLISHMRRKMPRQNGIMASNTYQQKPGLIVVATPYAHYMNEGIKYVMPENGKSAFYSPTYGYWSKKGVKKVSSGEPLNYHGGANRGAHFIERTLTEDLDEMLRDAQKGVGR